MEMGRDNWIRFILIWKAKLAKLDQQKLARRLKGTSATAWLPLEELKWATTWNMIKMDGGSDGNFVLHLPVG